MKRKIVAIGGGENGRYLGDKYAPYETENFDKEIIRLTNKEKPNFLFIVHSQKSLKIQESYYQTMKKIYGDMFGCDCKDLKSDELLDIDKVEEKIEWADIIYEGGGDTLEMINLWQSTGFDKVLYDAWQSGKVMCGISAGAVCWFKSCNSDSVDNFESVDCLNFINAHLTPHCDEERRYESTKGQLKENGLVGIMLSNCAAIEIIDDKYRIITSEPIEREIKDAYALRSYWKDEQYFEEVLSVSNEFEDIHKLLNK